MPKPAFGPDDFENPDAPKGEQRLRHDHPTVRDMSYEVGRDRQRWDLCKAAIVQTGIDARTGEDLLDVLDDEAPRPRLELFLKERPRGFGYVCDFVYSDCELPVAVYGTMVNHGRGLMINELELWRDGAQGRWEYRDEWGDYVGPDGEGLEPPDDLATYTGITPSLLRQLPLGQIVAVAQRCLARKDWEDDGIIWWGHGRVDTDELPDRGQEALRRGAGQAVPRRRGRPPLDDATLESVARAYLAEAAGGAGLTRRLAARFDRPEPTVRDWVATARRQGFLSSALPGKRGAAPGPRLIDGGP